MNKPQLSLWPWWPSSITTNIAKQTTLPGNLVFMPFVDDVTPIAELYQHGCKVVVAHQTPLPSLLAQAKLTPINKDAFKSTFIALGDSLKQNLPLRKRLANLYRTQCPHCKNTLSANYFVWHNTQADPIQKSITCPHCQFNGLTDITQADLSLLDTIETHGIRYHFLLERTAKPTAPLRAKLESLHQLYTPRALYALAEILMKIEVVAPNKNIERIFKAIFLDCLLLSTNLFKAKNPTKLPAKLRPPTQFLERNVWQLFKEQLAAWWQVTYTAKLAPQLSHLLQQHQNSIYFSAATPQTIAQQLPDESLSLILTAPPHHNPVISQLSVLWSGWLLGRNTAEALYPYLSQKYPDWNTYQVDLIKTLQSLQSKLKPDALCIFYFNPTTPHHPAALILAALRANFEVEDWEINQTQHQITLITVPPQPMPPLSTKKLQQAVREECEAAIEGYLSEHKQAVNRNHLILVAWQSLLFSGLLNQVLASMVKEMVLGWVMKQIKVVLAGVRS